MIVFSRPPGRKRRAGDVWTSSSGADARRWPRKTTLRAALQALTLSSRVPCDGPHHGGPRSSPKSLQGRQMYHPPMKVSTGPRRKIIPVKRFQLAG